MTQVRSQSAIFLPAAAPGKCLPGASARFKGLARAFSSLALGLSLMACVVVPVSLQAAPAAPDTASSRSGASTSAPAITLVESFPAETSLDDPSMPQAQDVWLEMIQNAKTSADFGEFYLSEVPNSSLTPILKAITDAAARGVKVRFMADAKFAKTYPEGLDALAKVPNIEVRKYDIGALKGGVLHAKYFIIDGREAFVGSQNFDYRSLTHIQELGVRIQIPTLVGQLSEIFALDWDLAGMMDVEPARAARAPGPIPPPTPFEYAGKPHAVRLVASPDGLLPKTVGFELEPLLKSFQLAKTSIRLELHSYQVVGYDKQTWSALDDALRQAAARGVKVELLISEWSKKKPKLEAVLGLAAVPGIVVKWVSIPQHSSGFIDFARTIHAKCAVVDGRFTWVSTSNFGRDYFYNSRNVGIVVEGEAFARQVTAWMDRVSSSSYATVVDPKATYEAPRIK